jgi:hypothetical protein
MLNAYEAWKKVSGHRYSILYLIAFCCDPDTHPLSESVRVCKIQDPSLFGEEASSVVWLFSFPFLYSYESCYFETLDLSIFFSFSFSFSFTVFFFFSAFVFLFFVLPLHFSPSLPLLHLLVSQVGMEEEGVLGIRRGILLRNYSAERTTCP